MKSERLTAGLPPSPILTAARFALAAAALALLAACSSTSGVRDNLSAADVSAGSVVNIDSLTAVIKANPGDASAYNVRGSAYGKAGKYREAIADFDAAIKINPGFYQAYANRALVQRMVGKDDLAFADYNQSLAINAGYAVAYVGRGNMYRQRRQYDLALADFNHAIQLDPSDARAYHNRGLIYQAQGQHVQAIADFGKAIQLAPGVPEPFNARGLSYLATGDTKAALDDFNEAIKRDKNSYEAWTNEGIVLEKMGEREKAFAAFAHASNINPRYAPATRGHAAHLRPGQGRHRRRQGRAAVGHVRRVAAVATAPLKSNAKTAARTTPSNVRRVTIPKRRGLSVPGFRMAAAPTSAIKTATSAILIQNHSLRPATPP